MDFALSRRCIQWRQAIRCAARALPGQACWDVAQGDRGTESSSRAKVFISEATIRIADRSVHRCGGLGITEEPNCPGHTT